jgi:4-amino-4-deoxy-L-arabinose transferase-like glycosyltransferase
VRDTAIWRRPGVFAPIAVALAVGFFLWWELVHRGVYSYATSIYPIDDADEWRYTACSRLVAHGYHLFDQVFSAQPPLLFVSLAGAMKVSGESIVGARSAEIALGAVALGASIWLAWQLGGRWAGAAAGILLAVSPGFLVYAHTIEAEGPMMAFSALALALGVAARRRDSLWLALLSGVVLAGAVLFKLFALEAALPLAWAVAGVWPLDRRALIRVISSATGAFVPLALDFGLVSPLYQWRQVIELHDRAASAALPNLLPPGRIVGDFLTLDAGLSILALAGLVIVLLARRFYAAGVLILWLPGSIVMLLLFRPLFPHHAAILTAPLAVCAAVGAGTVIEERLSLTRLLTGILVVAALIYLAFVPRLAHDDRHLLVTAPGGADPLVAWVRAHSTPAQFVAPDNVSLADMADRLVPPPLCDPSVVRTRAGYLTTADLITATKRYRPVLVLPTGVFAANAGYMHWLRAHYRKVTAPGGGSAYILSASGT